MEPRLSTWNSINSIWTE